MASDATFVVKFELLDDFVVTSHNSDLELAWLAKLCFVSKIKLRHSTCRGSTLSKNSNIH